ncbi:MAG: hypothetical protein MRQ07_05410 [Candidatus Midichloria sp.]|nr:hypothetical protein [Candidatus Midichloria sp.]
MTNILMNTVRLIIKDGKIMLLLLRDMQNTYSRKISTIQIHHSKVRHREQSRDRYLTREEIPQFFTAIAEEKNQAMKDFFLIALYISS